MREIEFIVKCRRQGLANGAYWAREYSTKRLRIHLESEDPTPLGLDLHAEIAVRRIAEKLPGDIGEGKAAFGEGFLEGIENEVKRREGEEEESF